MQETKRFYWSKFLSGKENYNVFFLMETISYILVKGTHINEWVCKWDRVGVNRAMFGYSFNNEPYHYVTIPTSPNRMADFINYVLMQFIVRQKHKIIQDFKNKTLRFDKDGSYLNIPHSHVSYDFQMFAFDEFINKKINILPIDWKAQKDNFVCEKVNVKLGRGLFIEYQYKINTSEFKGNSWKQTIEKKENEKLSDYLGRCLFFMKKITL